MAAYGFCLGFRPRTPLAVGVGQGGSARLDVDGWTLLLSPRWPGREKDLFASDGRTALVCDGFIDFRESWARRLLGHTAGATAEILLSAYRAFGPDLPRDVSGDYVFALVDADRRVLVAGRDALGTRRLLVREDRDAVWVATDPSFLTARGPSTLGFHGLSEYLVNGGLTSARTTVFTQIENIRRGAVRVFGDSRPREVVYWPPPLVETEGRDDEEHISAFRSILDDAVEDAMAAPGTVGVDVSGGLDSSTVAMVASRIARAKGRRLLGYSIVHPDTTQSDEEPFQRHIIEAADIPWLRFDADRFTDFDDCQSAGGAEPYTGVFQGGRIRGGEEVLEKEGVVAQLSGHGGDQAFCGDGFPPIHLASLLRRGRVGRWAEELLSWLGRGDRSLANLVFRCSIAPLRAGVFEAPRREPTWLSPRAREQIAAIRARQRVPDADLGDPAATAHLHHIVSLTACGVRSGARYEMRYPLIQRRMVELVLTLPWTMKVSRDMDRVIQRRGMEGTLPDAVRLRRDKGDVAPRMFKGLKRNWARVSSLSTGERLAALGLVEPRAFQAACERFRHGLSDDGLPLLIGALSLEAWLRTRP